MQRSTHLVLQELITFSILKSSCNQYKNQLGLPQLKHSKKNQFQKTLSTRARKRKTRKKTIKEVSSNPLIEEKSMDSGNASPRKPTIKADI